MKLLKSAFQLAPDLSFENRDIAFWFAASFIAPLYFGLISFFHANAFQYIVQDDARLHIVWLQRLTDPALFPNDTIADYFGIIQPAGFKRLYQLAASLGIEALTLAKVLPLLLAIASTAYLFWVAIALLPIPACGFLTTLLLNQNIWIRDDLISAAPRAFVYPIFSAFLYYLVKKSKIGQIISLILLGLFYPQMMMVAVSLLTLRLIRWRDRQPRLSRNPQDYAFWLIAIALTGTLLLTFSHQVAAQVGELTALEEMQSLPEFYSDGRGEYFGVPFLSFWFDGSSGLRLPLFPPVILLGVLLPLVTWQTKTKSLFTLASQITAQTWIVFQLLVCAIALFLLAHLIFPTLYLPSRYTFYSTRFVLILACGLMLTLVSCDWWIWIVKQKKRVRDWNWLDFIGVQASSILAIAILITPAIPFLFLGGQGWVVAQPIHIFEHIANSPKDSLVASLVTDINDNIPAFSQRSVLTGREFALPYHRDFYAEMRERAEGLVRSQYTPDPLVLKSFIDTYGLDIWIIDKDFTSPGYLDRQPWLLNSSMRPSVEAARSQLLQGVEPAIVSTLSDCSTFEKRNLVVVDAQCVALKAM